MFKNLKKIRKENNISAKELAEVLGLKTEAAYYKKENGSIKFSLEEAEKISKYFNLDIEEIFFKNQVS